MPYKTYIGLEIAATTIITYLFSVVPGLFQTEEYARALTAGMVPDLPEDQVRQAVEVRLIRQQILARDEPPEVHAVIDESALYRLVGSPSVMQDQLRTIAEHAARPNVTVQVIPLAAGPHPGLDSTFTILVLNEPKQSDVVYVEGLVGSIYLERPADLARYRQVFDQLRSLALSPEASIARIAAVAKEYTR